MTPFVQVAMCQSEGCERLADPHVGAGRHCGKCFEEISSLARLWDFEQHRRPEPVVKRGWPSLGDFVRDGFVLACAWWIVYKFTLWMAAQYFLEWSK